MQKVFSALHQVFGFTEFRTGQQDLIFEILAGRDVLGILPTGGGKSLCYQLPAILLDGITLVISPLIALMKDQIDDLQKLKIPAENLNTAVDFNKSREIMHNALAGKIKLLYVAPERLENEYFLTQASKWNISMVAVDEAHCVSSWGHDFRPSYKKIKKFVAQIEKLNKRPIVSAFTATATKQTQTDIVKELALKDPLIQINSFDRKNIFFQATLPSSKKDFLLDEIKDAGSVIVYCNTRKTVDKICEFLHSKKFSAEKYHAGLSDEARKTARENFINDRSKIIVATNAFGMGINKKNVRKVIHYNMPKNLESYYQEAGRAGRDGLPAKSVLLYSQKDFAVARYLIRESKEPLVEAKLQKMIAFCKSKTCLRKKILNYFGEEAEYCNNCSACNFRKSKKTNTFIITDKTTEAQKILSCIYRVRQGFGANTIIKILRKSKSEKILSNNFDELSTYGIMCEYSHNEIKKMIVQLLDEDFLKLGNYQTLKIMPKGKELLKGNKNFFLKTTSNQNFETSDSSIQNNALYKKLKCLRNKFAQRENVPLNFVFSDSVLENICAELPKTEKEFSLVEGVGILKCKKYGHKFLKLINKFILEESISKKIKTAKPKTEFTHSNSNSRKKIPSHLISLELYKNANTVFEVAEKRCLTVSTIVKHLETCVNEGNVFQVQNEISEEKLLAIKNATSKIGSRYLKPIKKLVGENISYDEIKVGLFILENSQTSMN